MQHNALYNIKIMPQNFGFWPKCLFLDMKNSFSTNNTFDLLLSIFITFKLWFLVKTSYCWFDFYPQENFVFWPKLWFFDQNLDCWSKFRFVTKFAIFDQNLNFWLQFRIFPIFNSYLIPGMGLIETSNGLDSKSSNSIDLSAFKLTKYAKYLHFPFNEK